MPSKIHPQILLKSLISEVETRVGPQKQAMGFSQMFPWLGKLALRGDVAAEAAKAAKRRFDATRLKLFYEVKDAYFECYYLGRAIGVVRKNRDLIKYLEEVARTRYKLASTGLPEVIRAEVEYGKLEDQFRSLADLRGPLVARLNAALNRPVDTALPLPESIPEEHIDATDAQVLRWLREANPELSALDHEIARSRHGIALARKDYFPDVTLGLNYTDVGSPPRMGGAGLSSPAALRSLSRLGQGMGDAIDLYALGKSVLPNSRPSDAGKDVWMVSVSMNVPIRHAKYAAATREARARFRAAKATRADYGNALSARAKRVLFELRDAARKVNLYRDSLIPKAKQALGSFEAAFRLGEASFLDLVDAERILLDFELSYQRAFANQAQRLAELEMLVGRDIPRRPAGLPKGQPPGAAGDEADQR